MSLPKRTPVALPRVHLHAYVAPQTRVALERERHRRGMRLGALIDWLCAPIIHDKPTKGTP